MILREIQLKNIRSYVELAPFQFPEGTSLFFGGVGSGKSSLLYAIEFALFGLGELKGSDLLRNGAFEGFVSFTFEEDGREYKVRRDLRRAKATVNQVGGTISGVSESHSYDSVSEMKTRILEILKLNEKPQTGTSSVIYRYGIFTPQEQIKGIMEAPPESRLEILRRAFHLEKYFTARENAQAASRHLERVEIKVLEKQAEGLDEKKSQRNELIKQVEANDNKLKQLREELKEIEDTLIALGERKKELDKNLEEIQKCQAKIPLIKKQCEQDEKLIDSLKGELAKLEKDRAGFMDEIKRLQSLSKPTDKSEEQLETDIKSIEEQQKALATNRGANEKSLDNYRMLVTKSICPTCERAITDPSVYSEKYNKMSNDVAELLRKEQEVEENKRSLGSLLQSLRQYNAKIQNLPQVQKEVDAKTANINKKSGEIRDIERRLVESLKQISDFEKVVNSNKELLGNLGQAEIQINEKTVLRNNKDKEIALLVQDNSRLEKDRKRLEDEVREGEAALKQTGVYQRVINYLEQYFVPTIKRIETLVLQKIHEDFNDAFQKYFLMIIGLTEIEAYIEEDFSVVTVQGGYETPYYRLSGGEKTSVALAYRLALNQLIRKLAKIEGGLLILDEPTEGLSYAQVLNLREVFDDLECNQIILVSHEPQFLGFADKVFNVDKVDSASTISPY